MVIEERDLVFPLEVEQQAPGHLPQLITASNVSRLLSEHRYLADHRRHDLWLSLLSTFRLFEADGPGHKLGVAPLAGDLFRCQRDRRTLPIAHSAMMFCLGCLRVPQCL